MYCNFDDDFVKQVKRGLKLKKKTDFFDLLVEEETVVCTEIRRFYKTYLEKNNEPPSIFQIILYMSDYQYVNIDKDNVDRILGDRNFDAYDVLDSIPDIEREIMTLEDIYELVSDDILDYASKENEYPEEYYIVRDMVLKRDYHMCVKCNNISGLCVHHINNRKTDNYLENLITLCNKCHNSLPIHRFRSKEINLNLVKELSITAIMRTHQMINKAP